MPCLWYQNVRDEIHAFLQDPERLQNWTVFLIYIQIGCSLIGSLGALYSGVSLITLGIALFAMIAIASDMEHLIRIYAVLLFCTILLDISWFIFFSYRIWNMSSEGAGILFIISLRLTLAVEIVGVSVRFFSSLLWIQLFRLKAAQVVVSSPETDLHLGRGLLPKNPFNSRQFSDDDLRARVSADPIEVHRPPNRTSSVGHISFGRDESFFGTDDSLLNDAPVRGGFSY